MRSSKAKNCFDERLKLSQDLPLRIMRVLIGDLCGDSPLPNNVLRAIRSRDVEALIDSIAFFEPQSILKRVDTDKRGAGSFFCQYQVGSFLKKFPFKGKDTKTPALKKFFQAERICALFNKENHSLMTFLDVKHPDFLGIMSEIRGDISTLLGEFPDESRVYCYAKHGPGVSLGGLYEDGKTTSFFKWSNLPYSVTTGTLPYAKTAILSDPRWIGALDDWYRSKNSIPIGQPIDMTHFWGCVFEVVPGSRITTVPKTAKVDRTIAIEPLLNVYLQLGVDRILKSRLKRVWGYDLESQTRNQELAKLGSQNDELVTVDLSMASDLISLKVCEMLLPPAWYNLLLDLRSPVCEIDGSTHVFEKISSMGNGYTFALESLIFAALVRCSIRRTKSKRISAVFGDDLIVPVTAYPYLKELIQGFGFIINDEKTYISGPFRESCGKDYFLGHEVRPIFLKRKLSTVRDLFYIHNALFDLQKRLFWAWEVDFSETLKFIRRFIPQEIKKRFSGPCVETLDTHLFEDDHVFEHNKFGERVYEALISRPFVYRSGYTSFYFRKLMVSLGQKILQREWGRVSMNTGNAFDITKRDHVFCMSTTVRLPPW